MSSVMRFDEWQDSNGVPVLDGAGGNLALGKILQIVRATDATERATSSTSFTDASLSVTITPQKSDSILLLIHSSRRLAPNGGQVIKIQITDSSNVALSGAENNVSGSATDTTRDFGVSVGYVAAGTTSAQTFKVRFAVTGGTGRLENGASTGQLFAIEVAA